MGDYTRIRKERRDKHEKFDQYGSRRKSEEDAPIRILVLGCPCVDIACPDESMMALGKFAHHGVSIHPGDEGMEMIARKIYDCIVKFAH